MKKYSLRLTLIALLAITFSGCDNFFNPDTDVTLDSGDYIQEENEMYAGFLGIATKMQQIGDKVIYLTDTRAEMLEPTLAAPGELFELYNYNEDLSGNYYADPAGYYDVIIACNDYMHKLKAYKDKYSYSINMEHYDQLIGGTLRIKAWIYFTLGKIYGEALWFDDPMTEKQDISNFPVKNLDEIIVACKELLAVGFDGVSHKTKNLSFTPNGVEDKTGFWVRYVTQGTYTGEERTNTYWTWNVMAPEYFALWAELCLWSGDYQEVVDAILPMMNARMDGSGGNVDVRWLQGSKLAGDGNLFNKASLFYYATVSAITYSYMYDQTNSIVKHFNPNESLLAPSVAGMTRFIDIDFNHWPALTPNDPRLGGNHSTYSPQPYDPIRPDRKHYINKYMRSGNAASQPDIYIYIYRDADLYFMLSEAMNHLGRYAVSSALINNGYSGNPNLDWTGFDPAIWGGAASSSGGDKGIRGKWRTGNRPFQTGEFNDVNTKFNDLAILDEMMLEFSCEGRTLPAMIRMARRYDNDTIIADRVCPKYPEGQAETIRQRIHNGGYFIKWQLK